MAVLNFDANEVEPSVVPEPVPAGKYVAVITESAIKPTKSGTGHYLQLTFQIVDGEHQGRLLWVRLNLDNRNEMAVKIARAELSSICRAVGVMAPKDSLELHNLPTKITVTCKPRQDNGGMTNEIRGYESVRQSESPQPVTATADGSTPPWKNKS